jgi:lysophospholipase L1-like esterase
VSADGGTDVSVRQTETNALGADDAESSAVSVAASPDVYPLDEIATQPLFAYGAYKLRSAYSGPALRVVRPSDSATQDIGFSGANLDTSALDSFLAGQTGEIDIWYDQTGNGHNATQATSSLRPLIDSSGVAGGPILSAGKRAIILNGDTLAIPETVSLQRRAATIYCVTEQLFSAGTQSALFQLGSGSNQTSVFMVANTTGGRLIQLNSGGNSTFRTQQRPLIYESRYRTTAATTSQGSEVASFGAPADVAMAGGFVGNTALAGGYQGKFYATAFIAYASDLPDIDRTAVRSSLNTNHAITENPTDRVIYVGDSITVVSSTASPNHYGYPKMADAINGHSYHSYNVAGGGQRIEIQLSQYANQVGNILSAYSDNRVVVIAYGTNDISQGRTAAQIRADVESYCASIRGSGSKVVVGTILPATGHTSPMQTERDTYNAGIRADWATFADGLMDFAADPTMGPQAAASNTSLYPDGLHPSRLGHTYLAPIAAAAIASAL